MKKCTLLNFCVTLRRCRRIAPSREIDKFQEYYLNGMLTDVNLINSVVRYIAKRKGKQFRPRLCILSAKMCGEVNENTFNISTEAYNAFKVGL